ncbi:hypothetical protein B0J14DRAFT_572585 [Halenospora varia]|nr:hypothetical protein B0J14DRAFT_572585 [Halenospora varia]
MTACTITLSKASFLPILNPPNEILYRIFYYLDRVQSVCADLTCRSLYSVHRSVKGAKPVPLYVQTFNPYWNVESSRFHLHIDIPLGKSPKEEIGQNMKYSHTKHRFAAFRRRSERVKLRLERKDGGRSCRKCEKLGVCPKHKMLGGEPITYFVLMEFWGLIYLVVNQRRM